MKRFSILLIALVILTFTLGTAVVEAKTFYWYDMMEMPYLKYRPAHGLLSYSVMPFEFSGIQPVTQRYEQQLELTLGLSDSAEITGYFCSSDSAKIWSSTLKTKIIEENHFYLAVRGGVESYKYETALAGQDRFVTDAAALSQLSLSRNFHLHNNAEIAYTVGNSARFMLENGFIFYLNPYNTVQGNFNSRFENGKRIHSVEGAYKLLISSQSTFTLYLTRRLDNPALHCENILELRPNNTVTVKGNLIFNTGNANPENPVYKDNWIAVKAEKAFTNFSLFADLIHELDLLSGDGGMKFGITVKL